MATLILDVRVLPRCQAAVSERVGIGQPSRAVPVRQECGARTRPGAFVAGPPGQVIINASAFPAADEGPEGLEPFDFRIVLSDGREVEAEAHGLSRDLNLAFQTIEIPLYFCWKLKKIFSLQAAREKKFLFRISFAR